MAAHCQGSAAASALEATTAKRFYVRTFGRLPNKHECDSRGYSVHWVTWGGHLQGGGLRRDELLCPCPLRGQLAQLPLQVPIGLLQLSAMLKGRHLCSCLHIKEVAAGVTKHLGALPSSGLQGWAQLRDPK